MINEIYKTPPELVECLSGIDNMKIDSLDFLTEMIKVASQDFQIRFKKECTGESRLSQKYACGLSKSIYNCKSFIKYSVENNIVRFMKANWIHTHDIRQYQSNHRFALTQSQIKSIEEATRIGMTSGQIRIKDNLFIPSEVLYEIRRPILKNFKIEEIERMLKRVKSFSDYDVQVQTSLENRLRNLYCFNLKVIRNLYSQDIAILDDTSCTNLFGMPIIVSFTMDENGLTQITGFGLLENHEKSSFISYLLALKSIMGSNIRLFIVDRHIAQLFAIKETYPEAKIIFCYIHIKRNLIHALGLKHDVIKLFDEMIHNTSNEDAFIEQLLETKNNLKENNIKGEKVLLDLLNNQDYWIPSKINSYKHCGNTTTNRAEGFFGILKKEFLCKSMKPLDFVFQSIHNISERYFMRSISMINPLMPLELISEDDALSIGYMACGILLKEYGEFLDKWRKKKSVESEDCQDCSVCQSYGLPCFHIMLSRYRNGIDPMISIKDIPKRWIVSDGRQIIPNNPTKIIIYKNETNESNEWDYSTCISKFEYYFNIAKRSSKVKDALQLALDSLESLKKEETSSYSIQGQALVPISGRLEIIPRKYCDNISKSGKKRYRCSFCHDFGHTRPRCPFDKNTGSK